MKIGDNIEVIKDKYSPGYFIGLKGKIVEIADINEDCTRMNIGVLFREEDNKNFKYRFDKICGKTLYFDEDELKNIEG